LILINAFFAMSEIAIVTFNDNKLKRMAEDGNKRAATLLSMVTEPSKFLSTIQIGVTLSGFLASASAAEQFADPFAQMQKQAEEILRRRARPQEEQPQQQTVQDEPDLKAGTARTGIKRVTVVEDAVVVEEIRHKDL
jgi:hypothetical protein